MSLAVSSNHVTNQALDTIDLILRSAKPQANRFSLLITTLHSTISGEITPISREFSSLAKVKELFDQAKEESLKQQIFSRVTEKIKELDLLKNSQSITAYRVNILSSIIRHPACWQEANFEKLRVVLLNSPDGSWLIRPSNNPAHKAKELFTGYCVTIKRDAISFDHHGLLFSTAEAQINMFDPNKMVVKS